MTKAIALLIGILMTYMTARIVTALVLFFVVGPYLVSLQ